MQAKEIYTWVVTSSERGMRLRDFIFQKLGKSLSNKAIKRLLDAGRCSIDRRIEKFAAVPIAEGQQISLRWDESFLEQKQTPDDQAFHPHKILYEDPFILAYDKPAGFICDQKHMLHYTKTSSRPLSLVHRLDKDTTGALLMAKSTEVLENFIGMFKRHEVHKEYLAIVDGIIKKDRGTIENYLGKVAVLDGQSIWGKVNKDKGLYARTEWKVEKRGDNATLVRLFPYTGRTHQLRSHMAYIGHPILGDVHYGREFVCKTHPLRYLLHAEKLQFCHPFLFRDLVIKSPIPNDLSQALRELFV